MVAALSEFDLIAIELPQVGPAAPLAPALSLGLALSNDSMNKELAERFLSLLASEDAQRQIYELSGVLPATSAFTSEISNPLLRALLESNAEVFPVPDLSGSFAELAALEELITDSLARNENFETIYARYLEKLGEK
jgi:ABC-type glycerol-3-phosphate transport system substrate-binding protein